MGNVTEHVTCSCAPRPGVLQPRHTLKSCAVRISFVISRSLDRNNTLLHKSEVDVNTEVIVRDLAAVVRGRIMTRKQQRCSMLNRP